MKYDIACIFLSVRCLNAQQRPNLVTIYVRTVQSIGQLLESFARRFTRKFHSQDICCVNVNLHSNSVMQGYNIARISIIGCGIQEATEVRLKHPVARLSNYFGLRHKSAEIS